VTKNLNVKGKGSLLGAVGGIVIGAAILLFVATIVISNLKTVNTFGEVTDQATDSAAENASHAVNRAEWNDSNASFDQISTFLTVSAILLGVLGIVMIGAAIIQYIGGAFGG